jgi:hypothetical protein
MVTQETGSGLPEDNSHMSCVLVFLMAIDIIVLLVGCLYPSFYIQGGEVTKKVAESVTT